MILKICVIFSILALSRTSPINEDLTIRRDGADSLNVATQAVIASVGYPVEEHNVETEDGYILTMHRIPYGNDEPSPTEPRIPIFLMHGLMGSSYGFVGTLYNESLAFHLVNAGFDVWMGNYRGNSNSRKHSRLDPDVDSRTFFDFSWEQIGMYDLPAMIDYVLEYTGREKLHYIGHSQGGTTYLVMTSMRPEYNDKLISAHLLAGVGNMEHFPNEELRELAEFTDTIYVLAVTIGFVEVSADLASNMTSIGDIVGMFPSKRSYDCTGGRFSRQLCDLVGVTALLEEIEDDTSEITGVGGGSLKQIAHYGQNIRDGTFQRWNHGSPDANNAAYGQDTPPIYDLSLITTKTIMHYSLSDHLLDERDVLAMASVMPNTEARKVARDSFKHNDFIAALDAKELVIDFVIEAIKEDESNERQNSAESVSVVEVNEEVDQLAANILEESEIENFSSVDDNANNSGHKTNFSVFLCSCLVASVLKFSL